MADIGFANVEVLSAANTKVLAINNTRVSRGKGYGLMTPIATFEVAVSDILNALDVQSVKYGTWEEVTDYGGWGDTHYRCSVCGEEWYLEDGKPKDNNMNFCPRCGARMNLKDGDTNE